MTVLLIILKVIGILLLVLLGLLLVVAFCPLKYRVEGAKTEEEARVEVWASWLWGLLKLRALLWPEQDFSFRILGKELGGGTPSEETAGTLEAAESRSVEKTEAVGPRERRESVRPVEKTEAVRPREKSGEAANRAEADRPRFRESPPRQARGAGEVRRIAWEEGTPEPGPTPQRPPVGWAYFWEMPKAEKQALWQAAKGFLKRSLKILAPRRWEVSVVVGTGDPCTTGYVLGGCGVLTALWGSHLRVRGDFEQARLEGQGYLEGKIRAASVLGLVVWTWRQKPLRQLVGDFLQDRKGRNA